MLIENNYFLLTPALNFNGLIENIVITISDGINSDFTSFDVLVNPVNDAPELTFIGDEIIDEDTSLSLTLSATDIDEDDLVYDAGVNGNADVSVVENQLTVDPYDDFNGDIQVTVFVSDGDLSDSQTFTLSVTPTNDAPVIDSILDQEMNEDTTIEVALFGSDIDAGDVLSFSVDPTENATVSIIDNILTIDSEDNYNGTLTVMVSISDGQESDFTSFNVTVFPVNDAPELTFIEDEIIDEDTSLSLTLSATDIDDADIAISFYPVKFLTYLLFRAFHILNYLFL